MIYDGKTLYDVCMSEKVIGYILLASGVMVIIFSVISVWSVFTKQSRPVQLFTLKGVSLDVSQMMSSSLPPEFANFMQGNQPVTQEIVSAEMLNETSNLFAHLLFMGFLASAGAKLATIGTQLVRPINVKLKTESNASNKT